MQLVAKRRSNLAPIVWGVAPFLALGLGALIMYVAWPLSVTGQLFFDLVINAGREETHIVYLVGWIVLTLIVSIVAASIGLRTEKDGLSGTTLMGGVLLEFGIVVGHLWLGGLRVGTTMFSIIGAEASSRPVSPVFVLAVGGWLSLVLGVLLLRRRNRTARAAD